ncbi:MAG: hypothetical protein Q9175_003303 [Cornicularia normoerica]
MAESAQEMEIAMKRLLNTGEGADLTLVCRGKTWRVHSSYLWPRSSWFKAACKGGFKEGETQQIELPEEEPSMVYRMLQHLYMQTYIVNLGQDEFWSLNDSWAKTRLHVHAQMYSLGDKYDLPGLKKEAARRFNEDVKISGDSKCETLTLLSVVPTVYEITLDSDRGLRDIVVRQIFQRYATASKHFVEELDTALEVRQFARDIIVLHRKKPPTKHAALIREMYWIWHYCVPRLQVVTVISPPTTAAFRARLLATGISLARLVWLFSVVHGVLALVSILKGLFEMLLGQSRGSRYDWARTW